MSSVLSSANASNPAVKRIMREYAEFDHSYSASRQSGQSIDIVAGPLDDNLFEWHFTVRGPPSSPYAGGLYHGRVLLPSNYPFRPPDIVLLTPSGRFDTGKKICLSISSFHPNNWQPSWSIRTALTALSAFFTTPAAGAIGSLDYPDREKQQLAARSKEYVCPHCKQSNEHIMRKHSSGQSAPVTVAAGEGTEGTTEKGSMRSDVPLQPTLAATNGELAAPPTASMPINDRRDDANSTQVCRGATSHHSTPSTSTSTARSPLDRPSTHHLPLSASLARANPPRSNSPAALSAQSTNEADSHSTLPSTMSQSPQPLPAVATSSPPPPPTEAATPPSASSSSPPPSTSTSTSTSTVPTARSSSSGRLSVLTVSLAVLVAALLFRKLVAHLLSSQPSHASIVLQSL